MSEEQDKPVIEPKQERPINEVIDAVKGLVPDSFDNNRNLMIRLNSVQSSSLYGAPEMMPHFWVLFCGILTDEIGPSEEDWAVKIAQIVNDDLDYKDFL